MDTLIEEKLKEFDDKVSDSLTAMEFEDGVSAYKKIRRFLKQAMQEAYDKGYMEGEAAGARKNRADIQSEYVQGYSDGFKDGMTPNQCHCNYCDAVSKGDAGDITDPHKLPSK